MEPNEEVDIDGIPLSKIHPKYLHSNSTSHVWAFGAFAELIDNAYDPDVGASLISINKTEIDNMPCLVFIDNGAGMNREKLLKMLSFGFCEKGAYNDRESHKPIGQYGNGFKSGSMRLGKDAIVFTRRRDCACIGMLSQSYLEAINADSVRVPLLEYSVPTMRKSRSTTPNNLDAILKYSPFHSEFKLKEQLNSLADNIAGTKIIIYNLNRLQNGKEELDFTSNPDDILCPVSIIKDSSNVNNRPVEYIPEYKRSLRAYCSILYLCPKMKISIREQLVKSKFTSKTLFKTHKKSYKPSWLTSNEKHIKITLGFSCEQDSQNNYGFMLYHKNRLIKAYEKVGCQKQANEKGVGVIGVAELNFLTPTHNKQDFEKDEYFNTVMHTLSVRLSEYWNKESGSDTVGQIKLPDWTWVQCDTCLKWRRLPEETDPKSLPKLWNCSMNEDALYNRCFDEQESEDEEEIKEKKTTKSSCEKNTDKKSRKRKKTSTKIVEKATPVKRTKAKRNVLSAKDSTCKKKASEKVNTKTNKTRVLPSVVSDSEDDGDNNLEHLAPKKTVRRRLKLNRTLEVLDQAQSKPNLLNSNLPLSRNSKDSDCNAKDKTENFDLDSSLSENLFHNKPDRKCGSAQSVANGLNNIVSNVLKNRSNRFLQSNAECPGCSSWCENVDSEESSDLETFFLVNDIGKRKEERKDRRNETDLVSENFYSDEDAKQDKSVQAEIITKDKSMQTEDTLVKYEQTNDTNDQHMLTLFHHNVRELLGLISPDATETGEIKNIEEIVAQLIVLYKQKNQNNSTFI